MSVNRIWKDGLLTKGLQWATGALGLLPIGLAIFSLPVLAQIVPDNTLGNESSLVTPNVNIRGLPAERIDGGAVRGSALFHSFSEFNVNNGQRVYFSNPAGIADIFSRITGSNVSNILGTLGVDGGANLFVLNPNGILFGSNAQLDIQGSFLATTGSSFKFSDGSEFSATNPQAAPLLSINVTPGVQWGANQPGATITNRGNLKAGQDLTLAGGNLDLQGQLQAGRDLTLQAQDTVKVRDSVTNPFLAQSGRNFTIQGNQGIDILALNHPTQIPFVSGGNLSLISDGIISGDARFSSGDGFSIKSVSGGLANFVSLYDPIISANGDVDFVGSYTGTSLLVEATGNIRFQGDITITGPDTSTLPAGPDTATLSSGSALIMRSGQSTLAYGGVNSGGVPNYGTGNVPAGITLGGDVILQTFNGVGGTVTLLAASGDVSTKLISTNGRQDDRFWNGNANGGDISLTSTIGSITTGDLFSYSSSSSSSPNNGNGGAITLATTNGNISTGNLYSSSYSSSGNSGNGGAITLSTTNGNISTGSLDSRSQSQSYSNPGNSGNGGAITLSTTNGKISTGTLYSASSTRSDSNLPSGDSGNGGAITLSTTNGKISTGTLYSQSRSSSKSSGDGGTITISTTNGKITTQSLYSDSSPGSGKGGNGGAIALSTTGSDISIGVLSSLTSSYNGNTGNGGAITVSNTNGNISLLGWVDSLSYSYSGNSGNGGAITISTINGNISLMSSLNSYSYSPFGNSGIGGTISLSARDGDIFGNKVLTYVYVGNNYVIQERNPFLNSFSVSEQGIAGNGGNVTLEARNTVSNLDILTLSSSANAKAGDVRVEGFGNLSLTDTKILTSGQLKLQIQGQEITLDVGKAGQSGDVIVNSSGNLRFNNSRIESDTKGSDPAGDVTITSPGLITFNNSQIISNTSSTGQAGSISVYAPEIRFLDSTSALSAKTSSSGRAGDVNLQPHAGGQTLSVFFQDGAEISASSTSSGQGGNILVKAPQSVTLSGNGTLTAETSGSSRAGNVEITTPTLNVNGGAKVSTTTTSTVNTGTGGDITVSTNTLNLSGANSGLFAETRGAANAGNLTLNPYSGNDLQVNFAEGAKVSASTSGSGTGGNLKVTASNSVTLSGDGKLSAEATNGGNAGGVTINTSRLSLENGVEISANNVSSKEGGDINLQGLTTLNLNNSKISASTQTGQAGSINLNQGGNPATSVSLNNSSILAQADGEGGNAGGVTLNTSQLSLENRAKISASNISGTSQDITLQGLNTLQLSNNSEISASTGSGKGGSVSVNAPGGTVALTSDSHIKSEANGGEAGNLDITANQLTLRDGSSATVSSTGGGTAGKLAVSAPKVILENSARLAATTEAGSGGDIQLQNLSSLQLRNNSEISASTVSGKGGSVSVIAPGGTVALTGNSNLKAEATNGGNAGNLDITANQLRLRDSSSATVSSTGNGTAGKLAVSAPEVILEYSAKLAATTQAGSGGDIQLQNLSSLQLSNNTEISASTGSGTGGNVSVNAPRGTVALTDKSSLKAEATNGGQAGNLNITANQLTLREGSQATVSSPQGQAGNLFINANNLLLDGGQITAETGKRSAQGGANINLQVTDLLLLRHQSLISANATGDANGGNITISAPFVVAVPSENNDIIANAVSGDGGRINILDNYRVFGLKPQSGQEFKTLRNNRTSDISASSQSGIQGNINIQSLSVDPSQGLTALPVDIVDPSRQIVNRCGAGNAKSTNAQGEFVVTGRGGLPPSPDDMQTSGAITPGWVTRDGGNSSRSAAPVEPPATPSTPPLVEAQGMFINAKGEVVLTAQTPTTTPHQPGIAEPVCSPATQGNE